MGANTAAITPARPPAGEREQRLIAEAHAGSAQALAALQATYRPMVEGYLICLTGNLDATRTLAGEALAHMEQYLYGSRAAPSLPAWLLLATTDSGLAYLRHARALQLAGVGSHPRVVPTPARSGPTTWLRTALERFRPPAELSRGEGRSRASVTSQNGTLAAPRDRSWSATQRLRPNVMRRESRARVRLEQPAPDPRDTLRRRILRAVLADLAPEEARCLALHLVAGLSHAEVAYVCGLDPHMARAIIVEGLQLFVVRYDEAMELLGISPSVFDERTLARPASPTAAYSGPRTLAQREAVAPTYRLGGRSSVRTLPRALPRTIPRRPVSALPVRSATRAVSATTVRPSATALNETPSLGYAAQPTLVPVLSIDAGTSHTPGRLPADQAPN